MDYSEFKVPYISETKIKNYADATRKKHWGNEVPVDVEKIMEIKFNFSVIPLPELHDNFGIDSFISSNWGFVYVDNDRYLNDTHYKRVRFSLAHELGHFILHEKLYNNLNIENVEDYYEFYNAISEDQYSFLETQANKFAGYFLVPRDKLILEFNKLKKSKKSALVATGLEGISDDVLIDYMVDELAEIFNVSSHAMQICVESIN